MDKKMTAILAIVVVIIVAAAAVFMLTGNNDNKDNGGDVDKPTLVTVNVTGNSVDLATVSSAVEQLKNSDSCDTLEVKFPNTLTANMSTTVTVKADLIGELVSANGIIIISTGSGSVTLDKATLAGIGSKDAVLTIAISKDVTIATSTLGPDYDEASAAVTVTLKAGSEVTSLSGKATVSVPYTLKSGEDSKKVEIWYKKADGTLVEYPATYANGRVVFETNHFSTFFIAFLTLKEAKTDSISVDFTFNNEIRLAIFGNVNGDDRIDENDYTLLNNILKRKATYDAAKNCFADVNCDGVLNIDDLVALRDLVDRKECKLYYYDAASKVTSINYPLTGKIATYHVYPLDACIILGLYDQVVGMSNQGYLNSIGKDPSRYPGINDKIVNIGTPHEDPEGLLKTGANVYLIPWTYDNSKIESAIASENLDLQIVQLPMSKNGPSIVDQYGALLMLGFMTQTEDRAYEYIDFVDKIQVDINKAVSQISERFTYITPFFSSSSATSFKLDSPYKDGSMPGDCYTIQKLPMDSANIVVDSGCPEVTVEWLTVTNPDVVVLIMFDDYTHSVEDIQKEFDDTVEYLKYTDAYANKRIVGVNYYNIANYAGIPTLPLLASYIWPELFDTKDSMAMLQTYYEKYTAYDNPVVSQMGNALVYRMSVEETDEVAVDFEFNNAIRLAIFGNANGDDYLNEEDYKLLEKLIKSTVKYNPARHAFADVNCDGVLNNADLVALRDILDKKECKMYYYDAASKIASINYPLTGKIASYHVYPLDACIILGLYDQVVGMSNQGYLNSIGKDPSRYPGINDKIVNIGTPHEDPEGLLKTGANIYLIPWSYDNSKIESAIASDNVDLQIVQLPMSKNGPSIVDQYGALLMLGVMTQTEDRAYEYIGFVDKIQADINEAVSQIPDRFTYITPFFSSSSSTSFKLDSPYKNGSMPGDCYTIQKLPMDSVNIVVDSGCPEVTVEWLTVTNPDVVVLIMFNDYTSSVADVQKEFDDTVEYLKYTDAYANKRIVGVNYYNIANYAGIPTLPLLASYIWPELFDTDECMAMLQTYYEKYTAYQNPDVANMGNAIVYRMTPEITGEVAVDFEFNNSIRLAIFGNVNGDDYIDESDYRLLERLIIGAAQYDITKNAFADVNCDGVLNKADLVALRDILDKKECKMYYYDAASKIASINYPLTGKIASYHVYPLDACIILGLYDQVVGMSNQGYLNSIGKDPSRYPGINDKIVNIGTPHEDPEGLLKSGANVYLIPWTYDNSKIESAIASENLDLQIVQLPMSKNGPNIVDQYGALIMLGIMTQTEERAYEYIEFIDKIQADINEAVSQIPDRYTYITPFFSSSSATSFKLDSPYKNGSMPGDCYTVQKLPMDSVNIVVDSGCPEVTVEWLLVTNPDVVVLIMFNDYTSSVADVQKEFDDTVEYLKYTDAYANKRIVGVNYYNIANYAGIPTLPLLASYIWPDLFDTEESLAMLQTYYEKYTAYDNPVVSEMGNALVYRMA